MISYEPERFGSADYLEYSAHTDFSFPVHLHRCLELTWITDGAMEIQTERGNFLLTAGNAALFLPDQPHGYHTPESSEMISLIFSPKLVSAFLRYIQGQQAASPCFSPARIPIEDFIHTFSAAVHPHLLHEKGLLYLLCGEFADQADWNTSPAPDTTLLYQILHYIQQHFTEDLSLASLAAALGYDYYYLSRYFSKTVRIPFSRYLAEYRIHYAISLLEQTDLPVTEIAFRSGFSSLRTFHDAFRRVTGASPGTFRKQS